MELVICEGEEAFSQAVSRWCQTEIQKRHARSIFVPAGKTPEGLYARWERDRPRWLEGLALLQIDDVLTGPQQGLFRRFLLEKLPSFASTLQPIETCEGTADLALLGLGLNGHVAFHEPEIDSSFFGGCIRLGDQTCRTLDIEPGTWGISYGVQAFMRSKAILIMVKGASKRDILERVLKREAGIPAATLLVHPNLTIIADREARPED